MNTIPEWKLVLGKAWSIRFALLSGFFGGLETFLPMFSDVVPRGTFAVLCMFTSIGAVVSRLIMQQELREPDGKFHTTPDSDA